MRPVTAIQVTYHSLQVIGMSVASLQRDPNIEQIIIVDNDSKDGTADHIARTFPGVTLIRSPKNLGFGGGNNLALERVETEFALLINPDAALTNDTLTVLLDAARRYPDAGILAPQLCYEDGEPQVTYKPNLFSPQRRHGRALPASGDLCADFLSGALWLVRMDALRTTGFFDPAIFFYYEDDDLCLRMRKAGYANLLIADAHATHYRGQSSEASSDSRKFRLYHDTWSRLYMEYKYHGRNAAERMSQQKLCKCRYLLLLGRLAHIRSLVNRYEPRMNASRDFMSFLAGQPR